MKKIAKILWITCALSLAVLVATRYILGGWINFLYVPLGIFLISFVGAVGADFKFYIEFFTLKTTKDGLHMGVIILLFLSFLFCVNYFSVRYNKTWDFTEEKFNTLSDQSRKVLESLEEEVSFLIFHRGDRDKKKRLELHLALRLYKETTRLVKVNFVNVYEERKKAEKFFKEGEALRSVEVFVIHKGKKVKIAPPFEENSFTSALIQVTRKKNKTIYFLSGHGERNIRSKSEEGLQFFAEALKDMGYSVESLSLLEGNLPSTEHVLSIIGPQNQILDSEFELLRSWVQKGGQIFIAADPKKRHNINKLTEILGIHFKNDLILNRGIKFLSGTNIELSLGLVFHSSHEVTKPFISRKGFTLFNLASSLGEKKEANLSVEALISTPPRGFYSAKSFSDKKGKYASLPIVMTSKGSLGSGKPFKAVVVGDSDFLSEREIVNGFNKDVGLNIISYLADEGDLVSIQPKKMKGTKLSLTGVGQASILVMGLTIPLILFILSGLFFYRRRKL